MENSFGTFLREKRKERKFTIRQLSRVIGKCPSYISQLESGIRHAPKEDTIDDIADVLELGAPDRDKLFDLGAKSRDSVAHDLAGYINSHDEIREAIRVSKSCDVPESEWKSFLKDLKQKFLI